MPLGDAALSPSFGGCGVIVKRLRDDCAGFEPLFWRLRGDCEVIER